MSDLIKREDAITALEKIKSDWDNDYNRPINKCIFALTMLPSAEVEWIPCSERLPSETDYYLATIINGFDEEEVCIIWFAHVDDYNIAESEWREITDEDTVIAWQPLPKSYRKKRSK